MCPSHDRNGKDVIGGRLCDNKSDVESKNKKSRNSKIPSVLPALLVTNRREDGTIQRHYLDSPITQTLLRKFIDDFVHGRTEPEKKSSRSNISNDYDEDGRQEVSTTKHFINVLTAESLPHFLESHREKHVLVQLYAPTCGHCKRFNTVWNSLGTLIKFLGWSDQLVLARVDVTSNEIFVSGMAATWLPDLFYFGIGVSENPIHYGKSALADEVELGSISDPLDILEWWMDEAGDAIDEAELLNSLNEITTTSA